MALGSAARGRSTAAHRRTCASTPARAISSTRRCPQRSRWRCSTACSEAFSSRRVAAAARPVAEQALAIAAPEPDPEATAFANRMMGIVDWATGDVLAAAPRLRRSELYRGGEWKRHRSALLPRPLGLVAVSAGAGSVAARLCGSSDRSGFEDAGRELSRSTGDDDCFHLVFGSTLCEFVRADPLRGGHLFDEALDFCVKKDLRTYLPWSRFYGGLSSRLSAASAGQGLEMMRGGDGRGREDQHETSLDTISAVLRWPMHEPDRQKQR